MEFVNMENQSENLMRNANLIAYKIRGVFVSMTPLFACNIGIWQHGINVIFQDLRPMCCTKVIIKCNQRFV